MLWENPDELSGQPNLHTHTYIYIHTYIHIHTYIYIHSGILLNHKKNEIMPFAAICLDLEIIILSEVSQTEKDKYHITYMWNLK